MPAWEQDDGHMGITKLFSLIYVYLKFSIVKKSYPKSDSNKLSYKDVGALMDLRTTLLSDTHTHTHTSSFTLHLKAREH